MGIIGAVKQLVEAAINGKNITQGMAEAILHILDRVYGYRGPVSNNFTASLQKQEDGSFKFKDGTHIGSIFV